MTAPDEAHRRAEGAQIRDIWTAEKEAKRAAYFEELRQSRLPTGNGLLFAIPIAFAVVCIALGVVLAVRVF